MFRNLVSWALNNPFLIVLAGLALVGGGTYAFLEVNVEAYPDPAPPIIEVLAHNPGASAEEMEGRVTIPIEVLLGGMPALQFTRSKSLAGLSHLRNQFDYGVAYNACRQEVLNRLANTNGVLPSGVSP